MKIKINLICKIVILILMFSASAYSQSIIGSIGPLSTHKFEINNIVSPFNVYMSINQPTGLISFYNNINIESTSLFGDKGVINMGTQRFLHAFGSNTFLGKNSGYFDGGNGNTGIGQSTLSQNSEGNGNTAVGNGSLATNVLGSSNTAVGSGTLISNSEGYGNTALGFSSLSSNLAGNGNTAIGTQSLFNNFGDEMTNTGGYNTAVGNASLFGNISGIGNSSLGHQSGFNITTGNYNTAIGYDAQVPDGTLSNQVQIGNDNVSYAGVKVSWTYGSDRRLKSNILNSNLGLNFISKIRPVSYIRNSDVKQKSEYGFIAQEIEDVLKESGVDNSGMITVNDDGIYGLRYNDLLAPMVKAIQELKTENDELKKEIEQFKTVNDKIVKLEKIINELTSVKHTSLKNKEVNLTNSK